MGGKDFLSELFLSVAINFVVDQDYPISLGQCQTLKDTDNNRWKQAGAELCQAQDKLRLVSFRK